VLPAYQLSGAAPPHLATSQSRLMRGLTGPYCQLGGAPVAVNRNVHVIHVIGSR